MVNEKKSFSEGRLSKIVIEKKGFCVTFLTRTVRRKL